MRFENARTHEGAESRGGNMGQLEEEGIGRTSRSIRGGSSGKGRHGHPDNNFRGEAAVRDGQYGPSLQTSKNISTPVGSFCQKQENWTR